MRRSSKAPTSCAPKVIALYGANASGKTNVLRALEFIVTMIRDSVQRTAPGFVGCERFNDAGVHEPADARRD